MLVEVRLSPGPSQWIRRPCSRSPRWGQLGVRRRGRPEGRRGARSCSAFAVRSPSRMRVLPQMELRRLRDESQPRTRQTRTRPRWRTTTSVRRAHQLRRARLLASSPDGKGGSARISPVLDSRPKNLNDDCAMPPYSEWGRTGPPLWVPWAIIAGLCAVVVGLLATR
jgi:hypothetical protein